jgi:hypothetical protein
MFKIHRTIILPVLHGFETLSLTFRKEHRLKVFENMVLRKVFEPKREEVKGNGKGCILRSFMSSNSQKNIIRVIKSRKMRWAGMWHV